jgi:hypothetical protein
MAIAAQAVAGLLLPGCDGAVSGPDRSVVASPLVPTPAPASASIPEFTRTLVDATMAGDCKAIADLDGDGKPDLIVGGATLVWYRNPDWHRTTLATARTEITTDCQAADLNGDGRLDIVTGDGNGAANVVWFENPAKGGDWVRRTVGTHGNWVHDIEVADFDGDGHRDVLTHGNGTHLWYGSAGGQWFDRNLSSTDKTKEGIGIGDIDGDGRIDFVQGGWWFRNPGGRAAPWQSYPFAAGHDGGSFSAAIGDIDADGRADVALAEQHKRSELVWYRAPADARQGPWIKHVLDADIGAHKLHLVDLNGDGRLDIVAGLELAELRTYINRAGAAAAPAFSRMTLNDSGCHNVRVGDIDGNRAIDILCANYIEHPPVELWLNRPAPPLALDRWRHILVDSARERLGSGQPAFGLAFGDMDRDGRADIVSGRYFYRNPGAGMAGAWKRVALPVDADAMLVFDVDSDGQPDVIAQSLPSVYWLKPNGDASEWKVRTVASLPPTEHTNSQGYRLARIVAGSRQPEVVFTTGEGVHYLRVPQDPAAGTWPSVRIASGTTEDLLATGDIDGDGLDDVLASDRNDGKTIYWYRNPGTGAGDWSRRTVGEVSDWGDRAELADVDGDGRLDAVVAVENGKATDALTYWFQAPPDPGQPWKRHVIGSQASTNSMSVGKVDGRGALEVITGEHKGQLRTRIWNTEDGGQTWKDTLVDAGRESHLGSRVVDLDGDGLLDIVSIAYDAGKELHVWHNEAGASAPLASPGAQQTSRSVK